MSLPSAGEPPLDPVPVEDAHPHFLVQAPIPAVDADGVRVVAVGTTLFAVAAAVLALLQPQLAEAGRGWWLAVALSGFLLGLVGLSYCWHRSRQRPRGDDTP